MANPKPIEDFKGKFTPLKPADNGLQVFMDATAKKFADVEQLTKAILFVAVISLIGTVVAVVGLVVDQMHFNNQTYVQQAARNQDAVDQLRAEVQDLKTQNDKVDALTKTAQSGQKTN